MRGVVVGVGGRAGGGDRGTVVVRGRARAAI